MKHVMLLFVMRGRMFKAYNIKRFCSEWINSLGLCVRIILNLQAGYKITPHDQDSFIKSSVTKTPLCHKHCYVTSKTPLRNIEESSCTLLLLSACKWLIIHTVTYTCKILNLISHFWHFQIKFPTRQIHLESSITWKIV